MPNLLLLDPIGGITGKMFLAAALDLGVPPADLERPLHTLGIGGWRLVTSRAEANGIVGTHLDVLVEGTQPGLRELSDILALITASNLPPRACEAVRAVFERIALAEAKVQRIPVERVHFRDAGAVDSVVAVCGAAMVLDLLGWPRLVSATPELGQGSVATPHGATPIPRPAVVEILRGKPMRLSGPPGEAVTLNGAALLAALAEIGEPPAIASARIGYGVGTVRWPDRPNVLRMIHGEHTAATMDRDRDWNREGDKLWVLECNLDDCSGQLVARAIEVALKKGALDAWAQPTTMKKGRPGLLLSALAPAAHRESVARVFLAETTTLGVRFHSVARMELARELIPVETPYGIIRVKVASDRGRVLGAHPEYDDCLTRATEHGVAVKEVMAAALAAFRSR